VQHKHLIAHGIVSITGKKEKVNAAGRLKAWQA